MIGLSKSSEEHLRALHFLVIVCTVYEPLETLNPALLTEPAWALLNMDAGLKHQHNLAQLQLQL